jgi:hypothetical protein
MKWVQREDEKWWLAEVDSIPESASRATMSHFSYQLRHTYKKSRRWTNKIDDLLKKAIYIHAPPNTERVWNFRIHIIEILDAQ